ncbi:hypothetical protein ACWGIN_12995 [Streptomyces sp. NPDC054861]
MRRRNGLGRLPHALGVLLAGVLALTGCGIQQSDVVEAGGPATIAVAPGEGNRMLLFYVDADGRLTPAARSLPPLFGDDYRLAQGQVPPTYPRGMGVAARPALSALLRGPTAAERGAGLSTRLPQPGRKWTDDKRGPLVNVEPGEDGEPTLRVSVDFPLGDLDGTAARQLVCTAAYAEETDGRIPVVLSGPGSTRPAERCDDFEVGTPSQPEPDTPRETTGTTPADRRGSETAPSFGTPGPEPSPS